MIETTFKETTAFRLDDLYEIKGLSNPRLSPDGLQVACVLTVVDALRNDRKDYIALICIHDKQVQLLVEGAAPVWSPDGTMIAYESEESGQPAIWIYHLEKKSKRHLVNLYYSAYFNNHLEDKSFRWSPDGHSIAFVSAHPFSEEEVESKEVRVIDRLLYKSKGGRGRRYFSDNQREHVWIIAVAGGAPELLTTGIYNEHSIAWAPDSNHIAFISNRSTDPDNNQHDDLWAISVTTKQLLRLTKNKGTAFQPVWAPDGSCIAFLATESCISTNDSTAEDTHLYILPWGGGNSRCLTKNFDRRIENICWHPGAKAIYFTAGDKGMTPLFRISIIDGSVEALITGNFHILEYSLHTSGKEIAFTRMDVTHPTEIFLYQEEQDQLAQLTEQNTPLVKRCQFQEATSFWFESFDGLLIQGWVMQPYGYKTGSLYPLALVIHGGPHNMFGYDFEERIQLLASHGYGVLYINPRGSSGYGQTFSHGCVMNWGGGDFKDLMKGVDSAIEKYDWIDPERLFVTGQSYGGFMTNWIITQTNRFKAAVVDGGISNLISFAGTSLYHSLIESEFNGLAYDNFPLLWHYSPLRNVKNVITPTLFLHGEIDNEVPLSQAEEMYIGLKKVGVETMLVEYIGEGHGWRPDLKPNNRYDLYDRMINWFDRFAR